MKIARKLSFLERRAIWALRRATRQLAEIKSSRDQTRRELIVSPLLINILNTWAQFVRTYYICCALGAQRKGGARISSSLSVHGLSPNDVIGHAIKKFKVGAAPLSTGLWDTRDEPTWHDSSTLIALATHFTFSNINDIQAAFSFGFTAHKNLVVYRNYYGHRNRGTRTRAQTLASTYSIRTNQHPTEILLDAPLTSPGTPLIDVWISELEQTIQLLCS